MRRAAHSAAVRWPPALRCVCLGARAEPQRRRRMRSSRRRIATSNRSPMAAWPQYLDDFERPAAVRPLDCEIESPRNAIEPRQRTGPAEGAGPAHHVIAPGIRDDHLQAGRGPAPAKATAGCGPSMRCSPPAACSTSTAPWRCVPTLDKTWPAKSRQRARFAGLWKPRENSLLFAEWAGNIGRTDQPRRRRALVPHPQAGCAGLRRTAFAVRPRAGSSRGSGCCCRDLGQ